MFEQTFVNTPAGRGKPWTVVGSLGLQAGAVLALLVAIVREYFDRRLADPAAAEEILGVPDLGSVERLRGRQLAPLLRGRQLAPLTTSGGS